MDFKTCLRYVGNVKQLFRIDDLRLNGGTGSGMRMFQVQNGSDMAFTCSADRCMDIHYLRCKGQNLGFLTCVGDISPQYYNEEGFHWLHSFTAGFMTTCGLQTIGLPGEYLGEKHGLHGHISNCPAEEAGIRTAMDGNGPIGELRGVMRDCRPAGEDLTLTRTIQTAWKDPFIRIHDVVHNGGVSTSLHMILYHFNLGYPLLSEDTQLIIPTKRVSPRDSNAAAHLNDWYKMRPPEDGFPEMCYYHELRATPQGNTFVAAFEPVLGFGVAIHFNRSVLDHFVQWRQLTAGYYAVGLEPCNATIDGVQDAIDNGSAKWLEPGQDITYDLSIELLTDRIRFDELLAESETYT